MALSRPIPRVFRPSTPQQFHLYSDASDRAWGASLKHRDREIAVAAQEWTPREKRVHITTREALAAGRATTTLINHIPKGVELVIHADATSTVWALRNGSKVTALNKAVIPAVLACHQKHIHLSSEHIPGKENTRADMLSRNPDPQSYHLRPEVYRRMCKRFQVFPNLDLFANRMNRQTKQFCSLHVDSRSRGDAFNNNWARTTNWMNPPWEIIPQCLEKLKNDQATALVCLPGWRHAPWWETMCKMAVAPLVEIDNQSLYQGPDGTLMPAPQWSTIFTILTGGDHWISGRG